MNVTAVRRRVTSVPAALGLVAGAGSAAALFATYWDDSWHTDKGRDGLRDPPHLLLYGGFLLAAVAVAAWGRQAWRRAGWGAAGVRAVLAARAPARRYRGDDDPAPRPRRRRTPGFLDSSAHTRSRA